MFSTFRRVFILLMLSLSMGLFINQVYSEGIRWGLLKPQPGGSEVLSQARFISADSAFTLHLQGEAFFIDVRPREEYEIDHIPGAISIPLFSYYKSPEILSTLDPGGNYILYCFDEECTETNSLARELYQQKFSNIFILYGGLSDWLGKSYPMEE